MVTGGAVVVLARVVVGAADVDVVVESTRAAESDEFELHALANSSATTRAPTIDESLRIAGHYPAQTRRAWRVASLRSTA